MRDWRGRFALRQVCAVAEFRRFAAQRAEIFSRGQQFLRARVKYKGSCAIKEVVRAERHAFCALPRGRYFLSPRCGSARLPASLAREAPGALNGAFDARSTRGGAKALRSLRAGIYFRRGCRICRALSPNRTRRTALKRGNEPAIHNTHNTNLKCHEKVFYCRNIFISDYYARGNCAFGMGGEGRV